MNEREIFLAALEIEDPVARREHLQSVCAGDEALLSRVESLLVSHESPSAFLHTPVGEQLGNAAESGTAATLLIGQGADSLEQATDESDEEIPLGFLQPSMRKDSLGRLDHYEILQVIGQGAFGIVLRAFDDRLQRVVAIKVLAPALASTSPPRKRFLREAQASAAIRHENVVSVYAVEEKPLPYLVMEFIPGVTLQQRLDERGPLDLTTVLRLGTQIAEGLAAAHAMDLIHRDIKPANILLESGSRDRVKITDFGLARAADDASLTQSGMIAGTPMYMAPEQALGKKLDQRADLFSLGSVLYQMVSGRQPFRASTTLAVLKRLTEESPRPIQEIIPETPAWLCDIIGKLHAKDPADRYQSAREVADVLADCEAKLKAGARQQDFARIPQVKPVPSRSHRTKWATAALVVLLLILGVWFAPQALLYLSNRGELKLLPEEGLTSVIVLQNNEGDLTADKLLTPMTDWLSLAGKSQRLKLPPGRYQLNVRTWPADTRVTQWSITNTGPFGSDQITVPVINRSAIVTVERGHRVTLRPVVSMPAISPQPVSVAPESRDGWVQLFNGQDLTGWKTLPSAQGEWRVVEGAITYSGVDGHLFHELAPFENYHLRLQARINALGDGGVYFGVPFADLGAPRGFEANVSCSPRFPQGHTGSLWAHPALVEPTERLTRPNEWFDLEIMVQGTAITIKVNGKTTANHVAAEGGLSGSYIALQSKHADTVVSYRKIEIKELLPEPGWEPLFNGQDLVGWKTHPKQPGGWSVEKGCLVGRGGRSHLFTERGDYADFQLRVEAKLNSKGDSGIFFRSEYGVSRHRQAYDKYEPEGYEVQIFDDRPEPWYWNTGTLAGPDFDKPLQHVKDLLIRPDEWFRMEITALGNQMTVRVNDKRVVDYVDAARLYTRGHIALQLQDANTVVQFRKIEIKELSPPAAPLDNLAKHRFDTDQWIDVIPLIEPALDKWNVPQRTGKNAWRKEQNELVVGGDALASKLVLPLDSDWPAFECELEFTRRAGNSGLNLNIPAKQGECPLLFDPAGNNGAYFGSKAKGALLKAGAQLVTGQRAAVRVEIRRQQDADQVSVSLNGAALGQWTGDRNEIAYTYQEGFPHDRRLSLWIHPGGNEFVFHRIRVRMLDGATAETLRPVPAAPVATRPVLLRAFDPAKDKAMAPRGDQKQITVENGAWRIENALDNSISGNFNVLLGTVLDDIPAEGVLVLRAKVKLEPKHKDAWGALMLGDGSPSFHEYDWPQELYSYKGEITEWTEKEVRYPVEIFRRKNPPSVPVYVGLHGNGVLWIKDVELLHIPSTATAVSK